MGININGLIFLLLSMLIFDIYDIYHEQKTE